MNFRFIVPVGAFIKACMAIIQRVEKAITKLWVKIKEMGKKVLAKLGIGGKDAHDPEKQQKLMLSSCI